MIPSEALEKRIKNMENDILGASPHMLEKGSEILMPVYWREGYVLCRKLSEHQLQERKKLLEQRLIETVPITMDQIIQYMRTLIHRVTVKEILEEKMP